MELFVAVLNLAVFVVEVTSQPMLTTQPWQPPSEWDPALDIEKYPNPRKEATKCHQKSDDLWLCDPNHILSTAQSDVIINNFRRIEEAKQHKILVGVALVNKLKLLSQEEVGQKTNFSGESILKTTWSDFKPSCGDGCEGYVYVFLPWNDYQVFINTTSALESALHEKCPMEFDAFAGIAKRLNAADNVSNFACINATLELIRIYAEGECEQGPPCCLGWLATLAIIPIAGGGFYVGWRKKTCGKNKGDDKKEEKAEMNPKSEPNQTQTVNV